MHACMRTCVRGACIHSCLLAANARVLACMLEQVHDGLAAAAAASGPASSAAAPAPGTKPIAASAAPAVAAPAMPAAALVDLQARLKAAAMPSGGVGPPGMNAMRSAAPGGATATALAALLPLLQQQQQQQQQPRGVTLSAPALPVTGTVAAAPHGVAPIGAGGPLRVFSLADVVGDTSAGVSARQAGVLQSAIRSLRVSAASAAMAPLARLPAEAFAEALNGKAISLPEIMRTLAGQMDPVKAREHFGPGYAFGAPATGPPPAVPPPPPAASGAVAALMTALLRQKQQQQ
eukprot:209116-Chlamydomonas_euryale.AAC.5